MPEVTVIAEINVYETPKHLADRIRYGLLRLALSLRIRDGIPAFTQRSVWLCAGRLAEECDYAEHATRILAPASKEQATRLISGLTRVLESAGVTVHQDLVVDD